MTGVPANPTVGSASLDRCEQGQGVIYAKISPGGKVSEIGNQFSAFTTEQQPLIGNSDLILMPSIMDVGGLNPLLEMVLSNAAGAITGMVKAYQPYRPSGRKVICFTMYGTTTPGVSRTVTEMNQAGYETWIFHASGTGGQTMEKLMRMGYVTAVMDLTLAEIGAHLLGGLHDGGPHRLETAGELGLPQVIVPGAADSDYLRVRRD